MVLNRAFCYRAEQAFTLGADADASHGRRVARAGDVHVGPYIDRCRRAFMNRRRGDEPTCVEWALGADADASHGRRVARAGDVHVGPYIDRCRRAFMNRRRGDEPTCVEWARTRALRGGVRVFVAPRYNEGSRESIPNRGASTDRAPFPHQGGERACPSVFPTRFPRPRPVAPRYNEGSRESIPNRGASTDRAPFPHQGGERACPSVFPTRFPRPRP